MTFFNTLLTLLKTNLLQALGSSEQILFSVVVFIFTLEPMME